MRGTRTVLASTLFVLVIIIINTPGAKAADECLTKPGGPTPKGQHWYYRIDHANNGRQCWYLRAENAPTRKIERQAEVDSSASAKRKAERSAQLASPSQTPENRPDGSVPVSAAPIPWLDTPPLPDSVLFLRSADPTTPESQRESDPPTAAENPTSTVAADPALPVAIGQRAIAAQPRRERRINELRSTPTQTAQSKARPVTSQIDHTFALLIVLFATIAITGPTLHFVERRRRREAISFKPPPWARVVALNAPTPRIGVVRPHPTPSQLAPIPVRPSDQTERLSRALQQLIDRLQTMQRPEPKAVRVGSAKRASM